MLSLIRAHRFIQPLLVWWTPGFQVMSKHLPSGGCKTMSLNLPDSCEASLATDDVLELIEKLFFSPSLDFLVTTTACLACRACRMIAEASLWVAPFRHFPLMESTSSPFWIVPSWQARPLGNTLWTYWRAQSPHTHTEGKRKEDITKSLS